MFKSSMCLFLASISNGCPQTLRSPQREEEETPTEEYTGKIHTHRTLAYCMVGSCARYSWEGFCACVFV